MNVFTYVQMEEINIPWPRNPNILRQLNPSTKILRRIVRDIFKSIIPRCL